MEKLIVWQDSITDDIAHPKWEGYAVTIYNQGTFTLLINNMVRVQPGDQWTATSDARAWIHQIPSIAFAPNESKTYATLNKADLPDFLQRKGKFAVIQMLIPVEE